MCCNGAGGECAKSRRPHRRAVLATDGGGLPPHHERCEIPFKRSPSRLFAFRRARGGAGRKACVRASRENGLTRPWRGGGRKGSSSIRANSAVGNTGASRGSANISSIECRSRIASSRSSTEFFSMGTLKGELSTIVALPLTCEAGLSLGDEARQMPSRVSELGAPMNIRYRTLCRLGCHP